MTLLSFARASSTGTTAADLYLALSSSPSNAGARRVTTVLSSTTMTAVCSSEMAGGEDVISFKLSKVNPFHVPLPSYCRH